MSSMTSSKSRDPQSLSLFLEDRKLGKMDLVEVESFKAFR